jgi:hypothetical protein
MKRLVASLVVGVFVAQVGVGAVGGKPSTSAAPSPG